MGQRPESANDPPEFCCPISGEVMSDPVVLVQTGQTFDRQAIQSWFSRGVTTCPVTGEQLQRIQLAPNYTLKAMIQQWQVEQNSRGASSNGQYPVVQSSMYPDLSPSGAPQDKIEQIQAALAALRSPSMDDSSYREQRVYDLWTLSELVVDGPCCSELLSQKGLPLVLGCLPDGNSTGCQTAAARTIGRMAVSPHSHHVYSAAAAEGSIASLVQMLANSDVTKPGELSSREAAAVALRELAAVSRAAQEEIFFQMCAQAKRAGGGAGEPSFLAPLASLAHVPADSESLAAASLIVQLTKGMPVQDYSPYSAATGTSLVPCLIDLLQSPGSPAKQALMALLYTSNQMSIVGELVAALPNTDHQFLGIAKEAREAAGMLLWEAAVANLNLVPVLAQTGGMIAGLEQGLRIRSLSSAGIVQLLTCDHSRPSNSVVTPLNTDGIRLQLVSYDQVLPSLVQQLYSDDQTVAQAAAHALANLTAFRSGAASEPRFASLRRTSSRFTHHPSAMVIAGGDAVEKLFALLHCPDPNIVAPAIALLNNLCAENENRDKVRDVAKRLGLDRLRARLEEAMAWKMLPDRCRTGARVVVQRLTSGKLDRSPAQFLYITLLMKPPAEPLHA